MPTQINIENQVDQDEFDNQVTESITTGGAASSLQQASFDTTTGHDHNGTNSKKVGWADINNKPTTFSPASHAHNSHTGIGEDDHHPANQAGYDLIPTSVTVDDHFTAPDGSKLYLGDNIDGGQFYFDDSTNRIVINKRGSNQVDFYVVSNVNNTYIESPNVYLGGATSTVNFRTAVVTGQNWQITNGAATFTVVNGVAVSTSGISNVVKFNGVELEAEGVSSKLIVGNNVYRIDHSTHAQNTDTGTNQSSFIINSASPNKIRVSANNYTGIADTEAGVFNDTVTEKALVLAGNASGAGSTKRVKVYDNLTIQGALAVTGAATAEGLPVSTYDLGGSTGTIQDNSNVGRLQIGQALMQWGQSSGSGWRTVTFTTPYNTAPSVSCSCVDSSGADFRTRNITTTSFGIRSVDSGGNDVSANLSWIAIGSV